ncbi:MAG: HAD-IC family P-type ATPase [Dehalococcoidia bacterium]|nr:HAD-IC family P-type ATPase [Dehalococcoidia bacterium]
MTQAPPQADPSRAPGLHGLTSSEVLRRTQAGQVNADSSRQRTDADVVRGNALTLFNVVLFSLILALFFVGQFRDALFVGIVVIANVAVATLQELKATRTLRELRMLTAPHCTVVRDGQEESILAEDVVQGDLLHLKQGDQVVADGRVVDRVCEVDESLLTGESDSVRKESGAELRSGSFCTAGDCYYVAEKVGVEAYAVKLAAESRELVKRTTPLMIRFNRILRVLLIATGLLGAMLAIQYLNEDRGIGDAIRDTAATVTTIVPAGLLLGITVSLAVGAVRVSRAGAIVQDINAVEALNYTDVVCLDKTGTITANRLTLKDIHFVPGEERNRSWLAAFAVATATDSKTAGALAESLAAESNEARPDGSVPFNSERRWSALRLERMGERRIFVLGAPETVLPGVASGAEELMERYREAAETGLRGIVFAEAKSMPDPEKPLAGLRPIALITIGDVLRPEVREAFAMMERLGIEPKLISGDNPRTVASLLAQLGITTKGGAISGADLEGLSPEQFSHAVAEHTVFGRIAPHQKAQIVTALREQGHFVAMVGDGANDVQALRAADVAVAMASGTSTARAVAGIVLLKDSFTALIRGAAEATAVLGNAARLSKLFIAKSLYAYLLIVATNMLGLDFPFLPRQGSVTALLTLGIPAVFISISIPPPDAGRDFTRNVLRFALPASLALAAAAVIVHLLTEGVLGRNIEEARTLVSLTVGITGLFFMVEVLGFEGASWRSLTRPVLTSVLGALLVAGFLFTIYTPALRDFFDFEPMHTDDWVIVGVAVAASLAGQYLLSRYWPFVIDILTARPKESERLRGRAA